VQADGALVPELRGVGELLHQAVVELERGGQVVADQVHLGHRLQHQAAVLAAVEGEAVFAQRLDVVPLLAEGEAEVEVREQLPLGHLGAHRLEGGAAAERLGLPLLEGEVGLGAPERRVEGEGALGGGARLLVLSHVAVDEGEEVVRVGVVGVEAHGAPQRLERGVVQAAVVERLAVVELRDRALGVALRGAPEPLAGLVHPAPRLFGEAQLDEGGDVVGVPREQRLELLDRRGVLAEGCEDAAELPAGGAVVGLAAQ